MSRELPSFDLVVATVDRAAALGRFLDSVQSQDYSGVRVIVVDQGDDDSVTSVLARRSIETAHVRSERGLSRARNAAIEHVQADIVGFPDDDCTYPPDLLERVAERFRSDASLAGVTGRAQEAGGRSSASWKADAAVLTDDNLWNRAISFTIFLRREAVELVGAFDVRLGLGSGEPWSSGEEIDYLVRAIRGGSRIEYDPALVVLHDVRADDARIGYRDGASVGYILRKHRYPARAVTRMLVRPLGGALVSFLRLDVARARYHLAALRGRVLGLRSVQEL